MRLVVQAMLQTGRFHQLPGQNHNRLRVTLCNAFGLPVTSFGGFDDGSGALPGVLAQCCCRVTTAPSSGRLVAR